MKREVTVKLTLEWTFDQKGWSDEKTLIEDLRTNPKVVLGFDTVHSLYMLNDLDYPKIIDYKVTSA